VHHARVRRSRWPRRAAYAGIASVSISSPVASPIRPLAVAATDSGGRRRKGRRAIAPQDRVRVRRSRWAASRGGWPSRHNSTHMAEFEPIRIVGIIDSEISSPRNDGTAGSELYNIPFQLSQKPPVEWADYFPRAWDHPSSWTSSHRSGMIQVVGDRIWLNDTTIEAVEIAHKATLQLVLDETNREYGEYLSQQNLKQEGEQREIKSNDIRCGRPPGELSLTSCLFAHRRRHGAHFCTRSRGATAVVSWKGYRRRR